MFGDIHNKSIVSKVLFILAAFFSLKIGPSSGLYIEILYRGTECKM